MPMRNRMTGAAAMCLLAIAAVETASASPHAAEASLSTQPAIHRDDGTSVSSPSGLSGRSTAPAQLAGLPANGWYGYPAPVWGPPVWGYYPPVYRPAIGAGSGYGPAFYSPYPTPLPYPVYGPTYGLPMYGYGGGYPMYGYSYGYRYGW